MNKKGQVDSVVSVILIVGLLGILLFMGFIFAFGSSVLNWTFDNVVPEFNNFGMIGDTNASAISQSILNPLNSFVQNLQFFGAFIYILGMLGILGLAFVYRVSAQKWMIPLFFGLMFLLVIICIFMSNIYQDIYTGTDELAIRLQEQAVLSFLILYSPVIMSIMGFIGGGIMFSGGGTNE